MTDESHDKAEIRRRAAAWSLLLPGSGHALRGHRWQAFWVFSLTILLLGGTWGLRRVGGIEAAIFFLMLLVLPWWAFQSYGAGLAEPLGFRQALRAVWINAHDIHYLGALFLLTAFTDLYIIVTRPEYSLTVFCTKPAGIWGIMAKAQSPTLHTLIGYGFLRRRHWGLLLYLAYAGFGLLNASVNYACFGYGRIRTVFLISLVLFTAYIVWRRGCFTAGHRPGPAL